MIYLLLTLMFQSLPEPDLPAIALGDLVGLPSSIAREHLDAAISAGEATDTDPAMLLAIAKFESNFQQNTRTLEPQGKVSCGVMTPVPTYSRRECSSARSSLAAGYLAGARHLREWIDGCAAIGRPTTRCALLSYAGGSALRNYCARRWGNVCWRAYTRRVDLADKIKKILDTE